MTELPGILREIAEVAGEEAALAIARARGGTQVYIPEKAAPGHWLTELVGLELAGAIIRQLTCEVGGRRVDLPLGPCGHAAGQRARVDAMIRDNRSERDIALATGYSIRAVRRRRARIGRPADDRQLTFL